MGSIILLTKKLNSDVRLRGVASILESTGVGFWAFVSR